jgi:hypothetical protein
MSKYGLLETQIADQKHLIAALGEMGYRVEVHPQGAALVGYEGHERQEKANIIIRRQQLDSASNDIGFTRASDGRYVARWRSSSPRNPSRLFMLSNYIRICTNSRGLGTVKL